MADPQSRSGIRYLSPEIVEYLRQVHAPHDAALEAAYAAPERLGLPPIQVGPQEARLLGLLLRLVGARKVLEIGTLAGYSAIWMARALPEDGHLWTLELSSVHARVARENIASAGLSSKVSVVEGRALDWLPKLADKGPFDAVFLDADKGNYDAYGRWAASNVRPGGLLLADNAHFFGRLVEVGEEAAAVRRMHEEARQNFDTVCIGTGDGLLMGVKR
jgi:caffeoyl-CoA O-methyltransferase